MSLEQSIQEVIRIEPHEEMPLQPIRIPLLCDALRTRKNRLAEIFRVGSRPGYEHLLVFRHIASSSLFSVETKLVSAPSSPSAFANLNLGLGPRDGQMQEDTFPMNTLLQHCLRFLSSSHGQQEI